MHTNLALLVSRTLPAMRISGIDGMVTGGIGRLSRRIGRMQAAADDAVTFFGVTSTIRKVRAK